MPTGDPRLERSCDELADYMVKEFGDGEFGGFYFTQKEATDLIVRQKTATDSPLPSGNAVAAMVLLDIGQLAERAGTLALFAQQVESHGEGMSAMVQAALLYLRAAELFSVSAASDSIEPERPRSLDEVAQGVVSIRSAWDAPAELHLTLGVLRGFYINAHDVASGRVWALDRNQRERRQRNRRRDYLSRCPGPESRLPGSAAASLQRRSDDRDPFPRRPAIGAAGEFESDVSGVR